MADRGGGAVENRGGPADGGTAGFGEGSMRGSGSNVGTPSARMQTAVTAALRKHVGPERYDLWFEGNTKIAIDREGLVLFVPNKFFRDWLETEFRRELAAACKETFGKAIRVTFVIDETVFADGVQSAEPPKAKAPAKASKAAAQATQTATKPSKPVAAAHRTATPRDNPAPRRDRYTLEGFAVGAPNRIGHAAVVAMLEHPQHAVTPLYVYGGIGVGKTHLLRAAEHALRGRQTLKTACYNCEEFANEFIESYKTNKLPAFRKKIRGLDVLLLDDVQFLAGKRATQEELVYALDAIQLRGGKVAMTGDVHPRRLTKIGEDLRSRCLAGMAAKLEAPTRDLRRQIVARRLAERGAELTEDVVHFVADQIRANVRELEGAVNYLVHYARSQAGPLTVADARVALADLLRHTAPVLDLPTVLAKMCAYFGVAKARLADKSRTKQVSEQRGLFVYLLRKFAAGVSYAEIGRALGGFNHSTMIAAERRARDWIAKDQALVVGDRRWKMRDAVEALERELGATG